MLVSIDELCDYMDIKFTVRQKRAAGYVLSGLQSELESYLRRPIEVGEFDEVHVIGFESTSYPRSSFFYDSSLDTTNVGLSLTVTPVVIYPRVTPIASVQSVTVWRPAQDEADAVVQTPGEHYLVRRYGIDLYNAHPDDNVRIQYTGGLDGEAISVFRLLILRAASREMQNMHDDVVGLKDLETRNVGPAITGFTPEELRSVKRWKRVTVN